MRKATKLQGIGQRPVAEDSHSTHADALQATIALIRYRHRTRNVAMEARKTDDLRLGAFLRTQLGWSKTLPADERRVIAERAAALIELGEDELAGGETIDEPAYLEWRNVIVAALAARKPWDQVEKAATKEMERLATSLPVYPWAVSVRGFSARGLAVIVGEAGDLSAYPKKGHLWKRMGLAVMGAGDGIDDVRQGGLSKGASKDDWIAHGYSGKRRAAMFVIGESLMRTHGPYREIYLARKAYERTRAEAMGLTVAPAAKIPKARAAEFMSDGHVNSRALRYMEKRLLRDLWAAWRGGQPLRADKADEPVPPSNTSPRGEAIAAA